MFCATSHHVSNQKTYAVLDNLFCPASGEASFLSGCVRPTATAGPGTRSRIRKALFKYFTNLQMTHLLI